jgi:hypothetical protein
MHASYYLNGWFLAIKMGIQISVTGDVDRSRTIPDGSYVILPQRSGHRRERHRHGPELKSGHRDFIPSGRAGGLF